MTRFSPPQESPRDPASPGAHQSPAGSAPGVPTPAQSRWSQFWAFVCVAMAFADASIVVLALPQIVTRLHTSISHVVWVIIAYNLALIVGSVAVMVFTRRLRSRWLLLGGLALFGVASLGAGVAGSLRVLVVLRTVQGLGGALLLCGSLPFLTAATRSGRTGPLHRWAAAAAFGAAIGPAAGGLLTEVFSWRAIFFAQAPVAALALAAVWSLPDPGAEPETSPSPSSTPDPSSRRDPRELDGAVANLALALASAGLIGALFLVTVLLIDVWGLTPLAGAVVLSAIPISTALTERFVRGRRPVPIAAAGAVLLAAGLAALGLATHREVGLAVAALVLCGIGLGCLYPPLTAVALGGHGGSLRRVARTIAARDGGLVIGLLVLTPVLVDRLNAAPKSAIPPIARAVFAAPVPGDVKLGLGTGLLAANAKASQAELPDIRPAFAQARQHAPSAQAQLGVLQRGVHDVIVRAATGSFRRPFLLCAVFALLVLPLLGISWRLRLRGREPL